MIDSPKGEQPYSYKNLYWQIPLRHLVCVRAADTDSFWKIDEILPKNPYRSVKPLPSNRKNLREALLVFRQFHKNVMNDSLKLNYPIPRSITSQLHSKL